MTEFLDELTGIIAILCAIGLPVGFGMYLALVAIRSKHKEKMELIKQGIVPAGQSKPTPNKYRTLRNGFLCIGIALGVIIGLLVSEYTTMGENNEYFVIGGSVLLFLGIAYVAFYLIVKDKKDIDSDIE